MPTDAPLLPDSFPLAPKGCEKPSQKFFGCFTAAGAQRPDAPDAAADREGLAACATELAAYAKCLAWSERKHGIAPLYRVPEAYRKGAEAS